VVVRRRGAEHVHGRLAQVASALGSALGAWLAGRIFDATGSYAIAFSGAAGAAAVAAVSVWASRMPRAEVG